MADFTAAPLKPTVDIAALDRLDIRAGTVVGVADGITPVLAVPSGARAG